MVNFINWPIELGTAQLVTLILLANVAIDLGGCLCARKNMTPRNFSESIEAATKEEILANTEETKNKTGAAANKFDDAEEAFRNTFIKNNLTDDVQGDNDEKAIANKMMILAILEHFLTNM